MHEPQPFVWSGRDDTPTEGVHARRWHQCIQPLAPSLPPGIALLGFACDAGVARNHGRVGAAAAPNAIRQALANLAWPSAPALYDAGDIHCIDDALETAQDSLSLTVSQLIQAGHTPLILGGGHETAYGSWCGLAEVTRSARIGIVNFDAHFDLRAAPHANSGTPFAQIAANCAQQQRPFHYLCLGIAEPSNTEALFTRAQVLGVQWLLDRELTPWYLDAALTRITAFINSIDVLYLSIDLDVLPAATMPAVSAPAARGVSLDILEALVAHLLASGKVVLADVVELNPHYDIDQHSAKVAARLVWQLAHALTPFSSLQQDA